MESDDKTTNYEKLLSLLTPSEAIKASDLPNYRSIFMRDRDRILYSKPFLRLAGKTQIYSTGFDDHARNRLTHTLEVSQIARTIASALSLNVDLAEAIALGHDIGHTPFGHAGERELNNILNFENQKINDKLFEKFIPADSVDFFSTTKAYDNLSDFKKTIEKNRGFKHNWQSLRALKHLSRDYECGNMQLTSLTLSGILFHSSLENKESNKPSFYNTDYELLKVQDKSPIWSPEGLIVAIADEIAQRHHDLEDSISCHYLTPEQVTTNILEKSANDEEIIELKRIMKDKYKDENNKQPLEVMANKTNQELVKIKKQLEDRTNIDDLFLHNLSTAIVNWLVTDIIKLQKRKYNELMSDLQLLSQEEAAKKYMIYSEETAQTDKLIQLRLRKVILNSRNVVRMDSRGSFIIRKLFRAYVTSPKQMPDNTLNSVFREYLRQLESDNCNKEKIKEWLNKKFYLFDNMSECRAYFDEFFDIKNDTKTIKISIPKNKEAVFDFRIEIPVNKFLFRICLMRVIADYISGMTDSYAEKEYRKLYGIIHDIDA